MPPPQSRPNTPLSLRFQCPFRYEILVHALPWWTKPSCVGGKLIAIENAPALCRSRAPASPAHQDARQRLGTRMQVQHFRQQGGITQWITKASHRPAAELLIGCSPVSIRRWCHSFSRFVSFVLARVRQSHSNQVTGKWAPWKLTYGM